MDYLKHYRTTPGFTKISSRGDGGLKLAEFGIINLKKGETHRLDAGADETVLIILGGTCDVSGDDFEFKDIGARRNVFSGKPHTVYIPRDKACDINALTDIEIAWTAAPSGLQTDAYVITPDQVTETEIGKENYRRAAYMVLTDKFASSCFFIGEAFVPSGNHASYPPHRHDFDNPPLEVDMEEIYFFKFNPEQGYGIQKIYTDDQSIDFTCTVKNNDTTLIPRGYHPVINAPGYTMYYLWIMAGGKHREFLSVIDPEHKWILNQEK